jgi:hypothetical protein
MNSEAGCLEIPVCILLQPTLIAVIILRPYAGLRVTLTTAQVPSPKSHMDHAPVVLMTPHISVGASGAESHASACTMLTSHLHAKLPTLTHIAGWLHACRLCMDSAWTLHGLCMDSAWMDRMGPAQSYTTALNTTPTQLSFISVL